MWLRRGGYSIKKYTSEKVFDPQTGEWQHERIVLRPLNPDYDSIVLDPDGEFLVVGEFVGVV